jgi:hypothetical protein
MTTTFHIFARAGSTPAARAASRRSGLPPTTGRRDRQHFNHNPKGQQ